MMKSKTPNQKQRGMFNMNYNVGNNSKYKTKEGLTIPLTVKRHTKENKFRGLIKHGNNDIWAYGSVIEHHNQCFIIEEFQMNDDNTFQNLNDMYPIIPHTVCQSIGINDRQDVPIYEGDIDMTPDVFGIITPRYVVYRYGRYGLELINKKDGDNIDKYDNITDAHYDSHENTFDGHIDLSTIIVAGNIYDGLSDECINQMNEVGNQSFILLDDELPF